MATHDPIAELLMNRTLSMEDTGMANFDALDRDLARVKGTRDRITELFAKRTPPLEDIGRSLLRAVGGKSTYGEELNALRAGRIKDFQSLYDVFSKERTAGLASRKQASADKQHIWEKLKYAREQGNQDATAILKAIEFYSGDDLKDRRVLAEELEKLPSDVTASNAWTVASQTANRLSLTGRFKGRGKSKATMSNRKVALLTKWRAAQDGQGEWTDVDQAEWDMIIQADPMDIMRRNILRDIAPAGTQPPGPEQIPPGVSADEPGIFERGYNYLFGGDDTSAPSGAGAAEPGTTPRSISPRGPRGRVGRAQQEAINPPLLPNGGIDRSGLVVGQVYLHPADGQIYRWTGAEFVKAR